MKKVIALAALCLAVSFVITAQEAMRPLNAKTGLWQMTATTTWTGVPPQYAAVLKSGQPRNYKSCVKTKDLSSNPFAEGTHDTCHWTVLKSTGTDMEVKGTSCDMGKEAGMTAELHGTIHVSDSEDGTGLFDVTLTGQGQTMKGRASYTGKWLSATCPANLNNE